MGYHKREIKKGVLGEFSKVQEEFTELFDAFEQTDKVLQICELTDLLGAIESFSEKQFNLTIEDLMKFTNKTKSAFEEGSRITINKI